MSVRLPEKSRATSSQRNEGTWIAIIFSLGIVAGLLALISLVFPDILGLVAVLGGFCGFLSLHYFTWGRWLMKSTHPQQEQETEPTAKDFNG